MLTTGTLPGGTVKFGSQRIFGDDTIVYDKDNSFKTEYSKPLNEAQQRVAEFHDNLLDDLARLDECERRRVELRNQKPPKKKADYSKMNVITGRPAFAPGHTASKFFSKVAPLEKGKFGAGAGDGSNLIEPDRNKSSGREFETMFIPVPSFEKAYSSLSPSQKLRVSGQKIMDAHKRHQAYWELDEVMRQEVEAFVNSGTYKRQRFQNTMNRSKGYNTTRGNTPGAVQPASEEQKKNDYFY